VGGRKQAAWLRGSREHQETLLKAACKAARNPAKSTTLPSNCGAESESNTFQPGRGKISRCQFNQRAGRLPELSSIQDLRQSTGGGGGKISGRAQCVSRAISEPNIN